MLLGEPLASLQIFFLDEFNKIVSQMSTNVRFFYHMPESSELK